MVRAEVGLFEMGAAVEERDASAPLCQLLRLFSFACYDAVRRFFGFR